MEPRTHLSTWKRHTPHAFQKHCRKPGPRPSAGRELEFARNAGGKTKTHVGMIMGLRRMLLLTLLMVPASALVIVKPAVYPSELRHAIAAFGPQAVGDPAACKADSHDCYPAVTGTIVGLNADVILYGCSRGRVTRSAAQGFHHACTEGQL